MGVPLLIDRPSIIIASVGRTGTKFFSLLFREIIPACSSFHEPDIVQYFGTTDRLRPFLERVRNAGIYRMLLLKLLGKWSLINLSDARLRGSLSEARAARELLWQRTHFVGSKPGNVYVESNAGYYGLIDILGRVFAHQRAIYIIRDAREWVRSEMNVGELYGKHGLRRLLSHKMPAASEFAGDRLGTYWAASSRFEKLCWAWSKLNAYALDSISKNPDARLFYFEKIFNEEQRYQPLNDLVAFAASLPGIETQSLGPTAGWLARRIHESAGGFPSWENWTTDQKKHFRDICGPLMDRLGYAI